MYPLPAPAPAQAPEQADLTLCHQTFITSIPGEVTECWQPAFHGPPCTPDFYAFNKRRKHVPATSAPLCPDYVPRHRAEQTA